MKHLVLIWIVLGSLPCIAQSAYSELQNDFDLRINSNGFLAIDLATNNPAFSEEGTNNHYLNQAGIWILAEDFNGNTFSAVQHYSGVDSFDFWPGPVDKVTGQTGDEELWNKTWEVDKTLINDHIANYSTTNYVVPDAIKLWPATGGNGFNDYLAAFVDANTNQVYDPENGDYPYIKGKKAVYCIFNDLANEHKASLGSEIGLEIYMMAYTGELNANVYLEYYIISRTPTDYKNVKVGFFMGGEVGNKLDNYVGNSGNQASSIDVPQFSFIYQGDDNDEGYFGASKPLVYAAFLNKEMTSSIAFTNGNGKNGLPQLTADYERYMNGKWKDGSALTYGENGQDTSGVSYPFIYDHDFGGANSWTEESSLSEPGVRNVVSMADCGPLSRNEHIKFDVVLGVEPDFSGEMSQLNEIVYDALWEERSFSSVNQRFTNKIAVFPNPTSNHFIISTETPEEFDMQILNSQGVAVYVNKLIIKDRYECNVSLAPGIYRVQLTNQNSNYNLPIIVIH